MSRRSSPAAGVGRAGWALLVTLAIALVPASTPVWLLGVNGHAGSGIGRDTVELPELPPLHERAPELYDEQGCIRVPPDEQGEADCGAEPLPGDAGPVDERAHRNLAGFRGPHYITELVRDDLTVLESTVRTTGSDEWTATGLVRNETREAVGGVTVHAVLFDEEGTALGSASAPVPVDPLRAGEPGPFRMAADVPAAAVGEVRWQVNAGDAAAESRRDAEIIVHWLRSYGGGRDVAVGNLLDEAVAEQRPYLLYGSVRNHAGTAIEQPAVVIAWLGDEGEVLHVAETPVVRPGSGDRLPALDAEEPGDLADFLHAEPEDPGAEFGGVMPMLWVVGS
ncbi:FxLYD domain-containing protein [Haloechinothrix sp. LS1_15]|uniref:FxLYD domain-containing protein n=1 Tax=Haloechinothrix sp. LS1_15 TaxID=2652248 RepID=UPI002944D678|nr:FxLYD domain-containing protein [Haloechinothrix sp. LS1_15]MDV6012407.1 hypothetical protein [Haloechinothrix sp. LS1_15]